MVFIKPAGAVMTNKTFTPLNYLFFILIILTSNLAAAYAAEYYVDGNSGNDELNNGSLDSPWKTITHAIGQATATDVIHIEYSDTPYMESIKLVSAPGISLIGMAQDGNRPIIESADEGVHTISLVNFSGTLQGLDITGAVNANGINCTASPGGVNNARIIDCRIHGNKFGVHVTTADNTGTSTPFVSRNIIDANSFCGIGNMQYSSASIDNNQIYENGNIAPPGGGICISQYSSPSIKNNIIRHNITAGIRINDWAVATIDGNQIYENGAGNLSDAGICISGQASPFIINNIIRHNDSSGINISNSANPEILNNTIAHHTNDGFPGTAIRVNQNEGISTLVVLNNIIAYNDIGLFSQSATACSSNDYNDLWQNGSNYSGFVNGANEIY
ncbi:MAG: hypothetical protein GQ559_06700, partial [Desulfobulbaceae bacterium]|nr:hypothetical protein [Desulfobulbaceae bacterium]